MPGFGTDIMAEKLTSGQFGSGGGNFLTNFFGNKLVQQMLASAGADILGRTGAKNTLATLNQSLASGNYANILKGILGGGLPEGSKMSADGKGVKLNIPNVNVGPGATSSNITPDQLFGAGGGGGAGGGPIAAPIAETTSSANGDIYSRLLDNMNPFASSQLDFSASDLAGIDPQLLTQALQLKLSGEALKGRRISDIADIEYKRQLGAEAEARTKAIPAATEAAGIKARSDALDSLSKLISATKVESLDRPFLIPSADGRQVTVREWNALPESEQEYSIYVNDAKSKNEKIMSRREFENLEPTERERFLRAAIKDQDLMKSAKELAAAGATKLSLGGKLEEKEAIDKLGARSLFRGDWTKEIDKIDQSSDEVFGLSQKYIKSGMAPQEANSRAVINSRLGAIVRKIEAADGKIVGREKEGDTYIYIVEWPDIKDSSGKLLMPGSTERIRYANR